MKIAILVAATTFAAALSGAALAQGESALSDTQFVQANRCLGLASSTKLDGAPDAKAFAAKLKEAGKRRDGSVLTRATEARDNAKREADRARPAGKTALAAERDGAECQGFMS